MKRNFKPNFNQTEKGSNNSNGGGEIKPLPLYPQWNKEWPKTSSDNETRYMVSFFYKFSLFRDIF